MRLPYAERAYVDPAKLRDYCLSPEHPEGRHKARVFRAALGLGRDDADLLARLLRAAVLAGDAELLDSDRYGQRFSVDGELAHAGRVARVRSVWMIRAGEDFPRLVTCFVL